MRTPTNQAGFSVVELVLVVVAVGVIGTVGYTVHNRMGTTKTAASETTQTASSKPAATSDVPSAPAIHSTSDLDKAAAALDQTDPSGSDTADASQLDSQTANF